MKDYYKILEVEKDASEEDIKKSYYKLAFKFHPDRSDFKQSEELFTEIVEAYAILSDPEKRLDYDNMLRGKSHGLIMKKNDPRDRYREPFGGMQDKPEQNSEPKKVTPEVAPDNAGTYNQAVTYALWFGILFTTLLFFDFVIPNRTVSEKVITLLDGDELDLRSEDVLVTDAGLKLRVSNKVSEAIKTVGEVQVEKTMVFARNKNINLSEWPYKAPITDIKMIPMVILMVLLAGITIIGIQKNISSKVQICCGISSGILSLIGLMIVLL